MLDSTLAQLLAVARGAVDESGYFPAMYARVTRRIIDRAGRGGFDDGQRMDRFVGSFARRYLDAQADPVGAPRCWRVAGDRVGDRGMLVVQHLLLGINAHVNHDLALTVVDLASRDVALASIKPDFDAVNAELEATYHELLRDLDRVTRWVGRAAAIGGGHLFNFSLRAARDQAWRTAVALHRSPAEARGGEIAVLDGAVTTLAGLIARPTLPFRWVVPIVRRLETRDPPEVTRRLLGPLA